MGMVKQDDGWRLPDRLWAQMEPLLPPRKPHSLGCHNPRVSDRAAMDAILFVLRTGCQWNALNGTGIFSSSSAHRRLQEWVDAGVFEAFWIQGLLNAAALWEIDRSWLALDGAMTKAPLGREKSGPNPTDRGKGGVKRSLLTDGYGISLAVVIDDANRHDMKLAKTTLDSLEIELPLLLSVWPQRLCMDKGYDYLQIQQLAVALGCRRHIHSRAEKQRKVVQRARRWVVDRTHGWLNRFRGLLIRWAKKAKNQFAFLHLACGIITWRSISLLG